MLHYEIRVYAFFNSFAFGLVFFSFTPIQVSDGVADIGW